MHRTDADGHDSNLFTDGNPGVDEATVIDENWLNAVQEELCNTIEDAGTTLVKGTNTQLSTLIQRLITSIEPGGRLTPTSGDPTAVAASNTMYYAPYKHDRIPLWNGSTWTVHEFTELSQADTDNTKSPSAATTGNNYDFFVWNDNGTLRISRGPAWSSDTSRGTGAGTTELEPLDGRLVNKVAITNGPLAQRGLYVGTARHLGSFAVSSFVCFIWNTYNRVRRYFHIPATTDSWNYSTATMREQNGASAHGRIQVVRGLNEDTVNVTVKASAGNNTATVRTVYTGIGLDSTTTIAGLASVGGVTSALETEMHAFYSGLPGLGFHYFAWLEKGAGTDTQTWFGDRGSPSDRQCGMIGDCWA